MLPINRTNTHKYGTHDAALIVVWLAPLIAHAMHMPIHVFHTTVHTINAQMHMYTIPSTHSTHLYASFERKRKTKKTLHPSPSEKYPKPTAYTILINFYQQQDDESALYLMATRNAVKNNPLNAKRLKVVDI